jgi:hypothetical protein
MAGGLVVVAGAVVFAVSLLIELGSYKPNIRVVVPGTHRIELDDPGEYTVYYEYESVIQGRVFSSDRTLSGVLVWITRVGEPDPLKLTHVSERESYETGRYAGGSILTFEAEEPGTYEITGVYPGRFQTGDSIVLAVGRPSLLRPVLSVLVFLLAGLLIGGFVIVRTFVRRRSADTPGAPAASPAPSD